MNYLRSKLLLLVLIGAVCCCLLASVSAANAAADDDDDQLDDFAFEGDEDAGGAKAGIGLKAQRRSDVLELGDIDLNEGAADDGDTEIATARRTGSTNAFAAKEHRIRIALQRATKQGPFTRKFAQILPILRTLNPQQRLVLASLITAQSSAAPGDGLNLKQVESIFGERRSLILPILFDIANLIKTAAGTAGSVAATVTKGSRTARTINSDIDRLPVDEFLKHAYIPLDNAGTSDAAAETDAAMILANLRDDRLLVDDTDDVLTTRNLVQTPQTLQNTSKAPTASAWTVVSPAKSTMPPSTRQRNYDQRSYHERKLNMTNFNSSTTSDQFAMESEGVPIQITLPRSGTVATQQPQHQMQQQQQYMQQQRQAQMQPQQQQLHQQQLHQQHQQHQQQQPQQHQAQQQQHHHQQQQSQQQQQQQQPQQQTQQQQQQQLQHQEQHQLTLEQYEELAFRDLNDTTPSGLQQQQQLTDSGEMVQLRNATTGELLPLPEMLISRQHAKNNPYRKLLAGGSNSLDAARQCERFGGTLCLHVEDYPMQAIMGSIRRHKHAMSALLAEYIDKEDVANTRALIEEAKRREDDELTPSGMCPSVIRYARPQKARSATGEWKYIVNTGQHTQTLRLEKCTKVDDPCTYLTDNFRSRCVQVFNYHRLLSWDNARGLHIDIFKVPTCCSCHIDSYKEKFPPVSSYNGLQDDYRFSASNINHHRHPSSHFPSSQSISPYATILSSSEPQLDDSSASGSSSHILSDEDDSIAYQFSNGFKRSPPSKAHHGKYRNGNSHHGGSEIGISSSNSGSSTSNKPLRLDKPRKPIASVHAFAPVSPTLDSYLTPPTSESEFDFVSPFKRGGTVTTSTTFDRSEIDIGSVSAGGGSSSGGQRNRNRRPVRTNNHDQTIAGSSSDYTVTAQTHDQAHSHHPQQHTHPLLLANTATSDSAAEAAAAATSPSSGGGGVLSSTVKRQSTSALSAGGLGGSVVASGTSTTYGGKARPPGATLSTLQHQLPSISTASTSAIDLGKRVNYNYHPIIDFFGDSLKSAKEIDDRVGVSETTRTWRPMAGGAGGGGPIRRRPHRR